jgi:hypothetical protein
VLPFEAMADAPEDEQPTEGRQPRFSQSQLPRASFVVRVVEGPDAGAALTVDGSQPSPVLLGQSPACDLRISDRSVSRRHAALEVVGDRMRIEDLDSTNGTTVNGVPIVKAFLVGGDVVRLASTVLHVERTPGGAKAPPPETRFGRLLGISNEMRRLYPLCARIAASDVPVVIEGETGTGKEVLAESLHEQGRRAAGPYVVFDCTAIPAALVEAELFGHERGAFTGAVAARQ